MPWGEISFQKQVLGINFELYLIPTSFVSFFRWRWETLSRKHQKEDKDIGSTGVLVTARFCTTGYRTQKNGKENRSRGRSRRLERRFYSRRVPGFGCKGGCGAKSGARFSLPVPTRWVECFGVYRAVDPSIKSATADLGGFPSPPAGGWDAENSEGGEQGRGSLNSYARIKGASQKLFFMPFIGIKKFFLLFAIFF